MQKGDKVRVIHERHFRYAKIGIITAIDPCVPYDTNALNLKYLVKFPCIIGNYGIFDESELEVVLDKIGSKEELSKAVSAIGGTIAPVQTVDVLDELDGELSTPTPNSLKQLKGLVKDYRTYKSHIDYLNVKLKEQKELFNKVSQSYIPDLLAQYNLDDIKLKDTKEKIIVESKCNVSIKKGREAEFYDYLKLRDEADIIKDTITVYNPSETLLKMIKAQVKKEDDESEEVTSTEFEMKRKIHPQTLKAHTKRLLEDDVKYSEALENLPDDATEKQVIAVDKLAFPPESLSVYVYSSTEIK